MSLVAETGVWAGASVALCVVALEAGRKRRHAMLILRRLGVASSRSGFRVAGPIGRDHVASPPQRALVARVRRHLGEPVRRRRADRQLIEWIDRATQIVRSGASLRQALVAGVDAMANPGPALQHLRDDLAAGSTLDHALAQFASADASPSATLAARSISLAGETGGRPSRLLEGVGLTVRERVECRREANALATQARSSAVVIMSAPLAFAVLAASVDPRVGAFLVGTPAGLACVVGGLGLKVVGCVWMARLVRSSA